MINCPWILSAAKRLFSLRLLAVVSVLALHLTMWGLDIESLYHEFSGSDKARKAAIINIISQTLYDAEITDSLYQCDKSTSPDVMDSFIHYLMAEHYNSLEQYEKSLDEGNKARAHIDPEVVSRFYSDVLGVVSNAQYHLGQIDASLETLLDAYNVDKQLEDPRLISSDLNSLAAIYLIVQQPGPGIDFIEKAIALERKMKRNDRLAVRLGTAAELYLINNDLDKAMSTIEEAYDIDKKDGREGNAAKRLLVKAAVQESMSQWQEAIATLQQALPTLEKSGNNYSLSTCHNLLGRANESLGHRAEAIAHFKKALAQSIKCSSPKNERDAEYGLWLAMRDDNPNVAMLHLERYTALTDSLYHKMTQMRPQVIDITAHHFEEAKWSHESAVKSELIKWAIIALALMLLIMIAGLFYAWRKGTLALKMQRQTLTMRDHFLANITQRLHTPLTVITNTGHQMVEQGRPSADETKRMGETIVKHSNDMLQLINQMINLENVKSSVELPDLKPGDIVLFVRLLVENFIGTAHSKLINLEFTSPMTSKTVVFAPNYVKRICHVLISNAIKYTPRNGRITVSLQALDGGRIRLSVDDTGVGIPQDARDRIFEPMYQASDDDDGVKTSTELSLVNLLVKALKGTINIETEPGKGTNFIIEFPVQPVESDGSADTETMQSFIEKRIKLSKTSQKQQPLVFIVENNEDVAYFIAMHLKEKYNLRFARDGQEALQNAQDLVPDLIITNMTMPVMDGWELIKRLRANSELNHIPIIALTANTSEQQRIACYDIGADIVLVKPFNSSELRLLADKLIASRNILREHFAKHENDMVGDKTPSATMSKEDKEFINKLIDVIHAQMAKDDIDMDHIAAALSLSRKQLRSRVMAITGQNPAAYVLKVRLNFARRMITNDSTPLTTVASRCGFQNLSHFSKAFKQQFGMSPLQYRKSIDDIGQPLPKG